MSLPLSGSDPAQTEEFLSGAYRRILRVTIGVSVLGTLAAMRLGGWRSGLGVAIGSGLAYLNFAWLHHGSELMVQRMLAPAGTGPSRLRLLLAFVGRYIFVIVVAYVILKSYPSMLVGFMVGLAFPILAAMYEGIYEAVASSSTS
jgi:hypothetical protein